MLAADVWFKYIDDLRFRKMDMLSSDLQLKNEATTRKKGAKGDEDESDPAFHFIAFMPAMGQLWKLDGLERQPRTLGVFCDPLMGEMGLTEI